MHEVKQLVINHRELHRTGCADNLLTTVYFDIKNGCVFEFNTVQRRWYGNYQRQNNQLAIQWREPGKAPAFTGVISPVNANAPLTLTGTVGKDTMSVTLQKVR